MAGATGALRGRSRAVNGSVRAAPACLAEEMPDLVGDVLWLLGLDEVTRMPPSPHPGRLESHVGARPGEGKHDRSLLQLPCLVSHPYGDQATEVRDEQPLPLRAYRPTSATAPCQVSSPRYCGSIRRQVGQSCAH